MLELGPHPVPESQWFLVKKNRVCRFTIITVRFLANSYLVAHSHLVEVVVCKEEEEGMGAVQDTVYQPLIHTSRCFPKNCI